MWGASCALAMLLLLAAVAVVADSITADADAASAASSDATGDTTNGTAEPLEDEVESAPFAIVVEHEDGWRCGGALVTLRAALSTATCARGRRPAPPDDLWARAPGAPAAVGARRITRVAVAVDSQGVTESEKWTEEAWIGAVLDMALLELEAPFAAAAGARPILMAEHDECEPQPGAPTSACHVVRTPAHTSAPLRVGNAERASPRTCANVAPHWTAVADKVFCLSGPHFCQSDWGAGVVCNGRLCGVLSRSARSSGEGSAEAGCGDTHAAQHLPRWHDFVNCAQTKDRCGRYECTEVCSERVLPEASAESTRGGAAGGAGGGGGGGGGDGRGGGSGGGGDSTEGRSRQPTTLDGNQDYDVSGTKVRVVSLSTEPTATPNDAEELWPGVEPGWRRAGVGAGAGSHAGADAKADTLPTRTPRSPPPTPTPTPAPTPAPPQPPPLHAGDTIKTVRMAHAEFEPYRADFKSGEYDDHGASYDSGEDSVRVASARDSPGQQDSLPAALLEPADQFKPWPPSSPPTLTTLPPTPPPPPPLPVILKKRRGRWRGSKNNTTPSRVGRLSATPFVICLRYIFVMLVFIRVI